MVLICQVFLIAIHADEAGLRMLIIIHRISVNSPCEVILANFTILPHFFVLPNLYNRLLLKLFDWLRVSQTKIAYHKNMVANLNDTLQQFLINLTIVLVINRQKLLILYLSNLLYPKHLYHSFNIDLNMPVHVWVPDPDKFLK